MVPFILQNAGTETGYNDAKCPEFIYFDDPYLHGLIEVEVIGQFAAELTKEQSFVSIQWSQKHILDVGLCFLGVGEGDAGTEGEERGRSIVNFGALHPKL